MTTATANRTSEKQKLYYAKQQLCMCITLFWKFLYRPCTTTTWKCLIASFMEDVNKWRQISFSLSNLECSPQEINSREIRIHLPFSANWNKRKNATKIETTGIHLKTDVFAAVAIVDAKAPYWANKLTSSISKELQWYCIEVKGSYKTEVFQAFFRNCIVVSITVMIFFHFYSSPCSSITDFHSLF